MDFLDNIEPLMEGEELDPLLEGELDMWFPQEAALPSSGSSGAGDAAGRWRCLDGDHRPGCSACAEAPGLGEEDGFSLLVENGARGCVCHFICLFSVNESFVVA